MSALSDLFARVRALAFRGREERELAEELRFHVEMESEYRQAAGVAPDEARRQSLLALGGVEQVKEDVRDARGTRLLLEGIGDFWYALRTLGRRPGFTTAAVLTLAIGIGGTTAVFSAVNAVLLQPLPFDQPGQLVRLYQPDSSQLDDRMFVTPVHFLAYRSRVASFAGAAAMRTYDESGADIGTGERVRRIRTLPISADYFGVVRVLPALGRGFTADEENGIGSESADAASSAAVVVSHELWMEALGGDRAAVGRSLTMSGRPFTVVGVMPKGYADPVAGAVDAWVPLDLSRGRDPNNAQNHYLTVIARLRPTVPIARAQAELDVLSAALAREYPDAHRARARLYPLKQDIVGGSSRALELLLGAVGLVLLLVCVNVANLLLVRGSERAHEFALRSALGAGRGRLVRQLLMESLTLALAGAFAGLAVARLAMAAIVAVGAGRIPRLAALTLDPWLAGVALGVAVLCAALFGLAPALRVARTQPGDVLREQGRSATGGGGQVRLRASLVVAQVALAFVLLVGAGLLLASFQRLRRVDLGVHVDNVLTFELHLPEARYDSTARARFYETVAQAVAAIPGVRAAGGVSHLPATGSYHNWGMMATTGPFARDRRGAVQAEQRIVSGDFFRAVGIPLVAGRYFDATDEAGSADHVIVSRGLARRIFPGGPALGQKLRTGGRESEIVGVVGEVSVDAEGHPDATIYHAHRQFAGDRNWALVQVVAATGAAEELVPEVRRRLRALDPGLVLFRPMPLADAIGRGAAERVFTLRILLTFAALALALSALGLFGVLSYGVKLRAREFAIRMALGAEPGRIRWMVLGQGLAMTALGIGAGLLGALALSRLMASLVFQVSPLDPAVLVGATVFLAVVGGVAAYLPAHRATAVDPRSALQEQ